MRIGILISDITRSGGTEKITTTIANVFEDKFNEVTIISCYKSEPSLAFHLDKRISTVYLNEQCAKESKYGRVIDYFSLIRKLRKQLSSQSFDILLCQSFPMTFIGLMASKGLNLKVIACEHTSYEYYSPAIRSLTTKFYKKAAALVVINRTDAQKYSEECSTVCYIPNIVDAKAIPLSGRHVTPHHIVSVGRLEHHKGFDRLIRAMAEVIKSHPEAILSIYGDGTERDNLRLLINELHLDKNVCLKGVVTDQNVLYSDKSIYVLPSRIEGFGLVLVEAASYGLPLIAFDCPNGPRDILINDSGILVEDNNIEALSKAILHLIDSEADWSYYQQKSLKIPPLYVSDTIYQQWENLFQRIQ